MIRPPRIEMLDAETARFGLVVLPVAPPTAGDRPQVTDGKQPHGRPMAAVALLLRAAPWICMREAPGVEPVPQVLGVTAAGKMESERHPVAWADADRQRAAHRAALRIGKKVRRLALRERVPLAEAARHLAECEAAAARSWQCGMGQWARRNVEGALAARDAAADSLAWRRRTAAIAKAFAAAAEAPAARRAVPFPSDWRPQKPHLGAAAAQRTRQDHSGLSAVIRRALHGTPQPGAN